MAAITGTKVKATEFSGQTKVLVISAAIGSASDTIDITEALHGADTILGILGYAITGGMDADFQAVQITRTDANTLTIVSKQADGAAADEFTGTTIEISLLVAA
jgi:hypothetical protein